MKRINNNKKTQNTNNLKKNSHCFCVKKSDITATHHPYTECTL